jgi:hypothetical protein
MREMINMIYRFKNYHWFKIGYGQIKDGNLLYVNFFNFRVGIDYMVLISFFWFFFGIEIILLFLEVVNVLGNIIGFGIWK